MSMIDYVHDVTNQSAKSGKPIRIKYYPDHHFVILAILKSAADSETKTEKLIEYSGKMSCGTPWKVQVETE